MRAAWGLCLLMGACAPAPAPRRVEAELIVPPIPDAGAPAFVRAAPRVAPEPPAKSAEEIARDECRQVMRHVVEIQINGSAVGTGMTAEQRKELMENVMQSVEDMASCPVIDEASRKCMLAATTTNDVSACAAANAGAPPPASPPRPHRPRRP